MQKKTRFICIFTVTLLLFGSLGLTGIDPTNLSLHATTVKAAAPGAEVKAETSNPLLSALSDLAARIKTFPGLSKLLDNAKAKWRLADSSSLPRVQSMQHLKTLLHSTQNNVQFEKLMPETRVFSATGDAVNNAAPMPEPAPSMSTMKEAPAMAPPPSAPADGPMAEVAETDMGSGRGGSSDDFSQTNVQVAGVDEGDVAKTDGEYIYSLSGGRLYIHKVNKGDIVVQSVTDTKISANELYLSGNKLVVAGTRYDDTGIQTPVPLNERIAADVAYYPLGVSLASYLVYDITDKRSPMLQQTFELEGYTAATRVIGSTLYFVINKYINYYYADDMELVPTFRDSAAGDALKALPVDRIAYFPGSEENSSYMIVGAMNLSEEDEVSFQTYLNDGASFYMNMNSLYIARHNWRNENTSIYRFEVTPWSVDFTSEGSVTGSVLNQYSMDEHNKFFRIATTSREGNRITIFDRDLNQVGKTPELAKGESIQSVRFMGDVAYMVTYLQTDPLYSVDLSDPYAPVILDELKIPGFSTYLHPVDGDWLVGFGRHTTEIFYRDDSGKEIPAGTRDMGQKVSLFDVSNPKKLREADVMLLGQNTWSEAFTNPKALMVDPARKQFGFFMDGYDNFTTVIKLIGVGNGKLKDAATISCGRGIYSYEARLIYIGDTLYAVFGNYLVAYDLNTFKEIGKAGELTSRGYEKYVVE